jgi:hypothetical protein
MTKLPTQEKQIIAEEMSPDFERRIFSAAKSELAALARLEKSRSRRNFFRSGIAIGATGVAAAFMLAQRRFNAQPEQLNGVLLSLSELWDDATFLDDPEVIAELELLAELDILEEWTES